VHEKVENIGNPRIHQTIHCINFQKCVVVGMLKNESKTKNSTLC
jgi:hypothetical protein